MSVKTPIDCTVGENDAQRRQRIKDVIARARENFDHFLQSKGCERSDYQLEIESWARMDIVFENKTHKRDGVYIYHNEKYPYAFVRNYVSGDDYVWHAVDDCDIDDKDSYNNKVSENRKKSYLSEQALRKQSAETLRSLIKKMPSIISHEYLVQKKIKATRNTYVYNGGELFVPLHDENGEIHGGQRILINKDGETTKLNFKGAQVTGFWHEIDRNINGRCDEIYICEGYATAVTIYESLGRSANVVFAAGSGNLFAVTEKLSMIHKDRKLIVCPDNDRFNPKKNVGLYYGQKCQDEIKNCVFKLPSFEHDSKGTDFNDVFCEFEIAEDGYKEVRHQLQQETPLIEFCGAYKAEQVDWLVDGLLPRSNVGLIYSPPSHYKTFLVLDMAMHIATGREWLGHKVKQGAVLYIGGEDYHSVKMRITAAAKKYGIDMMKTPMWATKMPINFGKPGSANTLKQQWRKQATHLEGYNSPVLVIYDTFSTNLDYELSENNAGDVSQYLSSCRELSTFFEGAAQLIVHHSPNDREITDRCRGSGAFKGGCDTEFSLSMQGCDTERREVSFNHTKSRCSALSPPTKVHMEFYEYTTDEGLTINTLIPTLALPSSTSKRDKPKLGPVSSVEKGAEDWHMFIKILWNFGITEDIRTGLALLQCAIGFRFFQEEAALQNISKSAFHRFVERAKNEEFILSDRKAYEGRILQFDNIKVAEYALKT